MARATAYAAAETALFVFSQVWRIDEIIDLDEWEWARKAACKGTDLTAWFEDDNALNRIRLLAVCDICPVVAECLQHALTHNEHGWWGGTSRRERNAMQGKYYKS